MKFKSVMVCLLVLPIVASAHHSRAEYLEAIQITGKLVDILWRNPHPGFTIEVEEGGQKTTWNIEGWSSLYTFDRADITQDRFQLGDTLSIAGLKSSRRPGRILATHILLADGTEAILKREAEPYWSAQTNLGGHVNWETKTRAAIVNAKEENRGIFRVWSYPSPNKQTKEYLPLTDSARKAQAEFDQVDNFITRCVTKGMPGSMGTPNPYEFIDQGDTIRIRGYEGDVVRTVHMNNAIDPATQAPSPQGYSVGHWEDDNTLVIHTTRIDFPYLGMSGIPLSDQVEVVEHYTLSEDQTRLDFKFTFTDPTAFTEPAYYEYYWLALGESFGQYDCDIH